MSYHSDQKDDKRAKMFWLIMVGITVALLGLKLCNVYDLYDILCYKLVFFPLYGPVLFALSGIIWAILVAIGKVVYSILFKKK